MSNNNHHFSPLSLLLSFVLLSSIYTYRLNSIDSYMCVHVSLVFFLRDERASSLLFPLFFPRVYSNNANYHITVDYSSYIQG